MRDEIYMHLKGGRVRRVIRDAWLIQAGREFRLSEAFDRWERAGIDLSRPFTVVVDKRGRRVTVEQERER